MNRENEMIPRYIVVVNHEKQYSIWPSGRAVPADWRAAGESGTKAECLAFILKCVRSVTPRAARAGVGDEVTITYK